MYRCEECGLYKGDLLRFVQQRRRDGVFYTLCKSCDEKRIVHHYKDTPRGKVCKRCFNVVEDMSAHEWKHNNEPVSA